jgi:hypothetical protein
MTKDQEIDDLLAERADILRQQRLLEDERERLQHEHKLAFRAMTDRAAEIKARLTQLRPEFGMERAFLDAAKELLGPEVYRQVAALAMLK